MAPVPDQSGSDEAGSDLAGAIEAIRSRVIASNPQLYRHLALYLQVLRQTLPQRVERACFHLATRYHSRRYLALEAAERQALHRRIARLVQRCSSLLTVEQLAVLAAQMSHESVRRRRRLQRRLLERLASGADLPSRLGRSPEPEGEQAGGTPAEHQQETMAQEPDAQDLPSLLPASLPFSLRLMEALDPAQPASPDSPASAEAEPPEGLETPPAAGHGSEDASADPDDSLPWPVDGGDPELWQQGLLPADPLELLRWLDGMELALRRRLRNLSHAINVELLRVGLSPTLLPVSLLDAALMGRVDSAQAPPQLLALPLPFPTPGLAEAGPQAIALLLRSADLELEEPRLRTCRRRLQHHRLELRRMADRFRRLQRRLDIHQAERLWLQDLPPAAPAAD